MIWFMYIYSLINTKYIIIFNYGNIFVFCEAEAHVVRDNTVCWTCIFKLSNALLLKWYHSLIPDYLNTNMLQVNWKIQITVTVFLLLSITLYFCNILISHSIFKHEFKCKSNYEILALHIDEETSGIKWPALSGWAGCTNL